MDFSFDFARYSARIRQFHEITIRRFYGFRVVDPAASRLLLQEIADMVHSEVKPKVIFWRCVDTLIREKIEVPSYTRLTKLILGAINRRSQELAAIIAQTLAEDTQSVLDDWLAQEPVEGQDTPGRTSPYKLTLMKKLSQSTKPSKIRERVADLDLVNGLYTQLSRALQALALKPEGIRYYAENVIRSKIFHLIRRNDPDRYLHLLAFIAHQDYRLQDNLVDTLLASLRSFHNGAIRAHKEQCYARREQRQEVLKMLLGGLEQGLVGTPTTIGSITEDQALSDAEKVDCIRTLLVQRETRRLLEKDPISELKASLVRELDEDDYYKILEAKSVWIQNRVSPILKALTFQGDPGIRKLVDAIEHFKAKDGVVDKSAPISFLDAEEQAAVNKDGKSRFSLYKALLFLHIQGGIKSGALNLEHSYKSRPCMITSSTAPAGSAINSSSSSTRGWRASSIHGRRSRNLTRPCTSSISLSIRTSPKERILTSNSRRTGASPLLLPNRRRPTRNLYSNTSPSAASCRWWKSSPQ